MKFVTLSNAQLFILCVLVSALTTLLFTLNSMYSSYKMLPEVHVDQAGTCIKVVNFENGHAFNCGDVNVVLRQYRTVRTQ